MAGYGNFASKIGLRPLRIRSIHGPSSGTPVFRDDDKMSTEELLMKRDLYSKYGARGMRQALAQSREDRLAGGQAFSQARQLQKDENEQEKFYVGKWLDLVAKARESGDMTLQKHLLNVGYDYVQRLSPGAAAISEALIRSGPFDKNAQKMKRWDEMNPAPRITADPETQPLAYAQQVFQVEDHAAQRSHTATGQSGPRRNMIPIVGKDGVFALRDDKGRVSVANEETLQIKEFASKFGITEGEVISHGGAFGKPVEVMVNGKLRKQRSFVSFPDNKVVLETLPGKTAEQLSKDEEQLAEFMSIYASDNADLRKKHKIVSAIDEMEKSGIPFQEISDTYLKPMYGVNFVKPKKEATIWSHLYDVVKPGDHVRSDGYVYGDTTSVKYFPGEITPLRIDNKTTKMVYYDDVSDTVYTPEGTRLGKPDQARNFINSELQKAEKRRQLEEEMKQLEKEGEEERIGSKKSQTSLSIRQPFGYYGGQKYSSMWE